MTCRRSFFSLPYYAAVSWHLLGIFLESLLSTADFVKIFFSVLASGFTEGLAVQTFALSVSPVGPLKQLCPLRKTIAKWREQCLRIKGKYLNRQLLAESGVKEAKLCSEWREGEREREWMEREHELSPCRQHCSCQKLFNSIWL